ncbi:MAG: hypothetical protein IJ994_06255 [Firmicutes bacterium]|nr:hypothetical protein [Bacillota bacterium]
MKKVDLLILTRHMYTMEGDGVGYLADHGVAVDSGKIVAVAPNDELRGEYQAEKVIDDPKLVLMPGFIDAHMHTGHAVIRGVAQDFYHTASDSINHTERCTCFHSSHYNVIAV